MSPTSRRNSSDYGRRAMAQRVVAPLIGVTALTFVAVCTTSAQSTTPQPNTTLQPSTTPLSAPSPGHPALRPKLPLRIANYGTAPVDCYVDGGLKCRLPAKYKCDLQVPPGRHSIRLTRPGGKVYSDSFSLPDTTTGKQYDGGVYSVKDDRVDFLLTRPHPH